METLVTVLALILVGAVIGWMSNATVNTLNNSKREIAELKAQLAKLQDAQAKHLPYATADSIEDATAALLYVKQANDLRSDMIDNCLAHLQKARNGNGKGK